VSKTPNGRKSLSRQDPDDQGGAEQTDCWEKLRPSRRYDGSDGNTRSDSEQLLQRQR
jgi:hypothetical protein